ncbi:MAG: HAMP domain-containing histidine kinase [Bifidobacteriaceae bacterium]|nr:HAMP domain-containing histidine kinase [Bifidobacteriaceae bacterium]
MKNPARGLLGQGRPLSLKLSAIIAALVVLGLSLAGTAITVALKLKLTNEVDAQLAATIATLAVPQQLDAAMSGPSDYVLMVYLPEGELGRAFTAGGGVQRALPDIPSMTADDALSRDGRAFTVGAASGRGKWRAVAALLSGPSNGAVVLALPFDSVNTTTHAMALMVVWTALAATILATSLGYVMVRRSLRPLKSVERAAARIAAGDLSTRIPPAPPGTEVGHLTGSLNAMLAQIEAAFAAQSASEARMRSFVSDASHELRTPLAAIRGYAELYRMGGLPDGEALAGAVKRIEDEAARMGLLVSDLLTLARLDEARAVAREPVDLLVLAGDAIADATALDPTRRVGLERRAGAATVVGDESALRRVVTNLVANAVRHTPAGTPIELAVGGARPGWAELEVRDHGPGIPQAKRAKVFDRFYRVDGSRSRDSGGAGLGLAIVAGLVRAHGGSVAVEDTPGGGATFRVLLPTAPGAGPDPG